MSTPPLRWGIVGCGKIANDFIMAFDKCERVHKVVAVSDISLDHANEFIEKMNLGNINSYDDYGKCIDDANVDVVYVATPNELHCKIVKRCVKSGKPALCEKPFGVNAREVKDAFDYAKKNKVFVMEATWSRFFPAWTEIRRIIRSNELGKAQVVNVTNGLKLGNMAANLNKAETPTLLTGLYLLMLTQFVFEKKPEKLTATGHIDPSTGVEEWANVVIEYGNKQLGNVLYHSKQWLPASAFISFEKGRLHLPSYFWCPTELIRIDASTNGEEMFFPEQTRTCIDYPLNDNREFVYVHSSGLRYEADHVYDKLQEGAIESDVMSHDDSIAVTEMMDEIRRQLGTSFPHDKH